MFGKLKSFFERERNEVIHPDFSIEDPDGFWRWNSSHFSPTAFQVRRLQEKGFRAAGRELPEIKVAFAFDNPKLLDKCPFLCKIGKNLNRDTAYFGVAYADEEDYEALQKWGSRFPRLEVLTYDSRPYEPKVVNETKE